MKIINLEKFKTREQILQRIANLSAQKFKKGQHGIRDREREIEALAEKLNAITNPNLDFESEEFKSWCNEK